MKVEAQSGNFSFANTRKNRVWFLVYMLLRKNCFKWWHTLLLSALWGETDGYLRLTGQPSRTPWWVLGDTVSKNKGRCDWMNQERLHQLVIRCQTVIPENMHLSSIIPTDPVIIRIYASIIICEKKFIFRVEWEVCGENCRKQREGRNVIILL